MISRFHLFLWIALGTLDQLTKMLSLSLLTPHFSISALSFGGIELYWTLTTNIGAAWGVLTQAPMLLLAIRLLFIGALIGMYATSKTAIKTALIIILAGACSNVLDTLVWGHVIDMVHVRLWEWDYPIFNIADSCICLGAFYLIWTSLFAKHEVK